MNILDCSGVFNFHRQAMHIARYEFSSQFVSGMTVGDITCGTGYGSYLLEKAGGKSIVGVDISEEAIQYACKKYSSRKTTFITSDAENTKFDNLTFDLIVSFETIEHVQDPGGLLGEFKRILKKMGK